MSKQSTIESLPPEIKAQVDELIRSGRYTIDGLVVAIQEAGEDRSRSAVGRYAARKKKTMEIYAEARDMAESLSTRFKEDPESNVSQMLGQVIQGVTFTTLQQLAEEGKAKPGELMLLSAVVKNLAGASKITFEQAQKIRKAAKEEAKEEAAKAITQAGKRAGISQETMDMMVQAVVSGQVT